MEQTTMFCGPSWPQTYEDIETLYQTYIRENEKDADVFTYSDTKSGRSYSFYGQKVFEFVPAGEKPSKLRILASMHYQDPDQPRKFVTVKPEQTDLPALLASLRQLKREIFRHTLADDYDTFGCCNDFVRCSDARHCLHAEERFSNGCGYRQNLEAGKIFYGENRNV